MKDEESVMTDCHEATPCMENVRTIVKNHTAKIFKWRNGDELVVDAQTANLLITIYDYEKTSESTKEKMDELIASSSHKMVKLVKICWTMV